MERKYGNPCAHAPSPSRPYAGLEAVGGPGPAPGGGWRSRGAWVRPEGAQGSARTHRGAGQGLLDPGADLG